MTLTTPLAEEEYFKGFKIFDVTYKVVKSHAIQTSLLVPRTACKGPRPVIVRFHGGGLVSGTRLYAPWFSSYLLKYALDHSAIIISPDYRLLPEACGLDILADISSLWTWLFTSLHTYILLRDPIYSYCGIDMKRIMVSGESAGGWLALQSAFMHPGQIKAILGIFPMLDLGDDHFTHGGRKSSIGMLLDNAIVDDYVTSAQTHPDRVVSSIMPPERMDFSVALFQHGRVGELLGRSRVLYPLELLEEVGRAGTRLPPLLIVHGTDDTVVPVEGSVRFAREWETWQRDSAVRLVLRPGEHGFEGKARAEEESWLREVLEWVADRWLN
ncbi:Alpha/Beta hydrolase protein [Macrophomina phaseolina]|uniref:Alpha/Beta hydrolase protein n=1 Tax=Macrophomina phaseolina TaxID=35725 RepID=A0ABQ8FWM3_9PEZI|nr:Alpha/Beta hydrolase protein [Macrophomina phaseolina]